VHNTTSCDPHPATHGQKTVGCSANYGQKTVGSSGLISGDTTLHNSILLNLELCFPAFLTQEDIWIKLGRIELATEVSIALLELETVGLIDWSNRRTDSSLQTVYTITNAGKLHLASLLSHGMASDSGEDLGDVSDHLIHKVPSPFSMAARLDRDS